MTVPFLFFSTNSCSYTFENRKWSTVLAISYKAQVPPYDGLTSYHSLSSSCSISYRATDHFMFAHSILFLYLHQGKNCPLLSQICNPQVLSAPFIWRNILHEDPSKQKTFLLSPPERKLFGISAAASAAAIKKHPTMVPCRFCVRIVV